jgi:hypothetical protein
VFGHIAGAQALQALRTAPARTMPEPAHA